MRWRLISGDALMCKMFSGLGTNLNIEFLSLSPNYEQTLKLMDEKKV
jgi:hypothetical protein